LADCFFNIGNVGGINLAMPRNEILDNYHAARRLQEELVREHPTVTEYRAALAHILGQVAAYPWLVGPAERLANLERARDVFEGLVRDNPGVVNYRRDLALTFYWIGERQWSSRDSTKALASLEQARKQAEILARDVPSELSSERLLGVVWDAEGGLFSEQGQYSASLHAYQHAIRHQRGALNKAAPKSIDRRDAGLDLVKHYESLVEIQQLLRQLPDALQSLRDAREVLGGMPAQTWADFFNDARLCCRTIGLIGLGRPSLTPSEQAERKELADQATSALRRAVDVRPARGLNAKNDSSFDPLRGRSDFQMIVMDLAFPRDALAP
jgi:tetratricopeptide (TPR) repeat protein